MQTILLSAPYMIPFVERFVPILEHYSLKVIVPEVHERMSEEEILAYAGQFDGTICGDDRYSERVLQACLPKLKVISKWGTGIDSINREAAARFGIQVRNTPNAFTLPVSDSVMGYILSFARQLPWMDDEVKAGRWEKLMGRSLSECTLGVIGVGNVGKAVLRRARGFGMKLLGNDIAPVAPEFIAEYGVEMTDLQDLLQRSDFVSTNADLNPTSHHIMNARTLAMMKPTAVLINTARGPLVDEAALAAALQRKQIAGAGMDVFEVEPLPLDSPLLKMKNVLLAPHNSNSSPAAWERVHWNTIRNLLDGLNIAHDDLEALQNKR
ncbi:MAG: phosphoglycerate dehydrogenase [Anaerolineae bacterium]|nr:phosphoglycerate dehydrogenase [Anaerolineae bacterium]